MTRKVTCARFFTTAPHYNNTALNKRPLQFFIHTVPAPTLMMKRLQRQGFFPKQVFPETKKSMETYLQEDGFDLQAMKHTPVELLRKPLKFAFSGQTFADIPQPYQSLIPVLDTYVTTIVNVLGDQLANRPYDPKEKLSENTSERGHALEALFITHQLRVCEKNKWAGLALQHDIARSTMADIHHGDRYHHLEADQILAPQGYSQEMATRFPFLHAFAKGMWSNYSKEYQSELLSPYSANSLLCQQKEAALIMQQLDDLYYSPDSTKQPEKSEQLLALVVRMMLLRLVDDSAKVVMPEIEQCFTSAQLKKIITEQTVAHIQTCSPEYFSQYQDLLKGALSLLRRTKVSSDYPERYQPIPEEDRLLSDFRGFQI